MHKAKGMVEPTQKRMARSGKQRQWHWPHSHWATRTDESVRWAIDEAQKAMPDMRSPIASSLLTETRDSWGLAAAATDTHRIVRHLWSDFHFAFFCFEQKNETKRRSFLNFLILLFVGWLAARCSCDSCDIQRKIYREKKKTNFPIITFSKTAIFLPLCARLGNQVPAAACCQPREAEKTRARAHTRLMGTNSAQQEKKNTMDVSKGKKK